MKKKSIILLTCAMLFITGCSSSTISETVNETIHKVSEQVSEEPAQTTLPKPTSTPGPKETKVALGKKGKVGDWKIGANKASVKKKITNGKYHYFEAKKGNTFVIISLSVRNNGKQAETFLPRVGYENTMIQAVLYYKDKYEYVASELFSYDKDLVGTSIQPLDTEKGIIAFEVPKKVAKSKKNLKLKIGTKNEYLVFSLSSK